MISKFSNPLLKRNFYASNEKFTLKSNIGLTSAILILFSITVLTYLASWIFYNELLLTSTDAISSIKNFAFVSGILSFIIAFFAYYKPGLSPLLAPLYAVFSGVFISGLSFAAEVKFPGIALLTAEITLLTFLIVYIGYKVGIIKVTQKFKAIVYTLIGVISLIYLFSFLLTFFGMKIPVIHEAGIGGIAWSFFIMITASFHLSIDIDKVENNNSKEGNKNWRLALGLMVSLIWLYISTLRFLSRIYRYKQ